MLNFFRKLDPVVHGLLLAGIIVLGVSVFYLRSQVVSLQESTPIRANPLYRPMQTDSYAGDSSFVTINEVRDIVEQAIKEKPTPTPTVKEVIVQKVQQAAQTTYLPLGSTSTSTSTTWYTLDDASSYVDVVNDYGGEPYITWEASLKVAHGNGQAFARLWDDTNKIAVDGSEVSTTNNSDYKLVKSGRIYLWNGNNLYKVQLKSLNGFEVGYSNGKIKITY